MFSDRALCSLIRPLAYLTDLRTLPIEHIASDTVPEGVSKCHMFSQRYHYKEQTKGFAQDTRLFVYLTAFAPYIKLRASDP